MGSKRLPHPKIRLRVTGFEARPLLSAHVQVTIGNNWCTLIADAANKEDIALRVQQIKKELAETDSVYDTEKLSERIAKLAGGVAVIKVLCLSYTVLRLRFSKTLL